MGLVSFTSFLNLVNCVSLLSSGGNVSIGVVLGSLCMLHEALAREIPNNSDTWISVISFPCSDEETEAGKTALLLSRKQPPPSSDHAVADFTLKGLSKQRC